MTLEQIQELKADLEQIRNFAWQGRVPSSHRPAKAAKHSDLFRFIHERAGKAIGELDKAFPVVQQGLLVKNEKGLPVMPPEYFQRHGPGGKVEE